MFAVDTNVLVRLAVADDAEQTDMVRAALREAGERGERYLVLPEVLLELFWVLRTRYGFQREEFCALVSALLASPFFSFVEETAIRNALNSFKLKGGFADQLIVARARALKAEGLLSFDRELAGLHPEYVVQRPGFVPPDAPMGE